MTNEQIVSKRISELLKSKGMTQRELAEAIGATNATVSRYITGKRMPHATNMMRIAQVFGVTMEDLMKGCK